MFQVITMWNLSRPDEEMKESVENIELRGCNSDTVLTGEFARRISLRLELDKQRKEGQISEDEYKRELRSSGAIGPLSVSNIADRYCPARRDLYFVKGINRPSDISDKTTWGRVAGNTVESYLNRILGENVEQGRSYSSLVNGGRSLNENFVNFNSRSIKRLQHIEEESEDVRTGDTNWFLQLLNYNGRAELGLKLLHSLIKEEESLDLTYIKGKQKISPSASQIGISSPASPDFIIPDFGVVGDIKTGINFTDHFLLTCAGYALAYENQHGKGYDINWGIIYFFPTRIPTEYVRPLTFTQIYIFPIDDSLRDWFIRVRDSAYDTISKPNPPDFPPEDERKHCKHCRFKDYCINKGLELKSYEKQQENTSN